MCFRIDENVDLCFFERYRYNNYCYGYKLFWLVGSKVLRTFHYSDDEPLLFVGEQSPECKYYPGRRAIGQKGYHVWSSIPSRPLASGQAYVKCRVYPEDILNLGIDTYYDTPCLTARYITPIKILGFNDLIDMLHREQI